MRVLYLDDDDRDVELVRVGCADLLGENCELVNASSRRAYEKELGEKSYDGILSDSGILELTGVDALRIARIRAPTTPFVFYCGALPPTVKEILRSEHPDGIFSKDTMSDLKLALDLIKMRSMASSA